MSTASADATAAAAAAAVADDAEFTIRITGAAPPPPPLLLLPVPPSSSSSSSSGKKRGGGGGGGVGGGGGKKKPAKKDDAAAADPAPPQKRRLEMRLRPSSSLDSLRRDVLALFGVAPSSRGVSILAGFPPRELRGGGGKQRGGDGGGTDDGTAADAAVTVRELGIRPNESLIARFFVLPSSSSSSSGGDADDAGGAGSATKAAAMRCDDGGDDDERGGRHRPPPLSAPPGEGGDGRRRKRASAVAASASFKDVIAAQDAESRRGGGESSSRWRPTKRVVAKKAGSDGGGNIVGFGGSAAVGFGGTTGSAASAGGRPKAAKMEGVGHRLSDGKPFAGSSPPAASRRGGGGAGGAFRSEDDIASKLLSSLGGGGGGAGNVGGYLRSAMRGAVAKSYEASRAAVRVAAVDAGEYALRKVGGGTVVDGGGVVLGTAADDRRDPPQRSEKRGDDEGGGVAARADDDVLGRTLFAVSYSKGMEGRGTYEEHVEIIGLAVLRSVLESVYNADPSSDDADFDNASSGGGGENADGRLRPVLIAQLSPRAFWSLVYHCSEGSTEDRRPTAAATARPSVEDMLRSTLPQLDWSHLDRGGRMRALSEKARENLNQRTAGASSTRSTSNNSRRDDDDSEARVRAVEDLAESALFAAMADENDGVELTERERRAKAAMARFENVNDAKTSSLQKNPVTSPPEDGWTLLTPHEDDIDELLECIMEGSFTSEEGRESSSIAGGGNSYDEATARSWAVILLDNAVRNWREMANISDPERILSLLPSSDEERSPPSRRRLPSCDVIGGWIDASRTRSLEEIMLDILDGDQDALESLRENARSCTPRDLTFWKSAPGMLLDAVMTPPPPRRPPDGGASVLPSITPDERRRWEKADAMRWIRRAGIAMGACPWLGEYTTRSVPR